MMTFASTATLLWLAAGPYCSALAECQLAVREAAKPAPIGEQCTAPDTLVNSGSREHKRVALTFDACSSGQLRFDREVYEVLDRMRAKATIFLGGTWIAHNRRSAHMIASNPLFELATHGYHHPHLPTLSQQDVEWEIVSGQRAVFQELGVWPRLFRAPYVEIAPHVMAAAKRADAVLVQCDLPSGDPDPLLKPEKIVRWVIDSARNGSIIVFHINQNGVHTRDTLGPAIAGLRARGFELVTVSELLGLEPAFTDGAYCYDPIVEQQRPTTEGGPDGAATLAYGGL